jgi:hypothetical protein
MKPHVKKTSHSVETSRLLKKNKAIKAATLAKKHMLDLFAHQGYLTSLEGKAYQDLCNAINKLYNSSIL